ncbi:MAG: winged helix-turn-helix domain-containing protein [Prevotella sp.]|jgi:hypothetical protein|nr:winged helix-turn-helix domain-containing protein [Prevotella sp.]
MAEKKTTKAATEKKVAAEKKTTTRKTVKRAEIVINAENVGFKAGDVYQALAADKKALSVKDIAKIANITEAETLLGIGWLFKEGKIKGENNLITLA